MATNETSVDLVIRAKDLSVQTFEKLNETLDRLVGGLDDLEKQGGPAARTFRELQTTAQDFAKVTNELTTRRGLAEQFVASGKAAVEARAGVEAAAKALKDYEASLEGVKRKSTDQKAELKALNAALKEQERQLKSALAGEASATRQAELRGLAIADLVQNYDALVAAEKRADEASVKAEANARNRDELARRAAQAKVEAAREAAVQAEQLARLEKADADLQAQALREQRALEEQLAQSQREQAAAERDAAERRERLRVTGEALLAQRLQEIAQQERAAAGLRELATEAERAAKATEQIDASRVNPEPVRRLADEVRGIVDPASKAVVSLRDVERTLAEVEAMQGRTAKGAALGADDLKKLAQGYTFLGNALKSVQGQAGLIDTFAAGQAEAQRLEAELQAVRQRLLEYALAARTAGADDGALQKGIRETTAEALRLTKALESAQASVVKYGQQLDQAGIDTRDLAGEQQHLLATTGRLKQAFDAANDGQTVLGQTVAKANAAQKNGFELQRTALSLYQRVRGQVLSLTAAYVGLFGVLSEAKATLDAATATQRLNTQLGVAFGNDPVVVAQELEFVREAANRLGVDLQAVGQAYGRFAISASSAGLSVAETRSVFESFATTSRVFALSADDTAGVFRALEQSLGKGKVQAEELRGQIADRLPGAVNIFSRALGVPVEQLDALFEKGAIKAGAAIQLFANEYAKAIKDQVVPASVRFDAEVGRLKTALFDFRNVVADSGFLSAMTALAQRTREFLQSAEGQQVARDLGTVLAGVATAITAGLIPAFLGLLDGLRAVFTLVSTVLSPLGDLAVALGTASDNTEAFSNAARALGQTLAIVGTALVAVKLGAWIDAAAVATRTTLSLSASFATLGAAVNTLVLPALAALAGYKLGEWLYDQFDLVKKAGVGIVSAVMLVIEGVKGGTAVVVDGIALIVRQGLSTLVSAVTERVQAIGRILAGAARAVGLDALAESIDSTLGKFGAGLAGELSASAERARQDVEASTKRMVEGVKNEYGLMLDGFAQIDQRAADKAREAAAERARAARNTFAETDPRRVDQGLSEARIAELRQQAIGGGGDKAAAKAAKKEADDQAALIKSTRAQVGDLSLRAAKKDATDLDAALAAVDQQYQDLFDNIARIAKFNPGESEALKWQAEAEKERIKANIRSDAELKAAGERVKAIEAERDAELELLRIKAGDDPAAQAQLIRDQADVTATYTARVLEAAQAEEALAIAQGKTLVAAQARAKITVLGATDQDRARKVAELQALNVELTQLTTERDARLAENEAIGPQGRDGLTGEQQRVAIVAEYEAKLRAIAETARQLALDLGNVDQAAKLGAFTASLDENQQKINDLSKSLQQDFASGFVNAIASADGSFSDFAKSFIRNILLMIAQARVLAAIQNSGGSQSFFSTIAGAVVGTNHTGGFPGRGGPRRTVDPAIFANAQRLHGGGIPGLKPGEVPTILMQNEEVLTRNDPRHVLNGGGGPKQDIKIINTIDPGEVASAGLGTPAGTRAFLNVLATNKSAVKKVLG